MLIYTLSRGKISYLLRTHKNNKLIHCSQLLQDNQKMINGRGGGKPDMAQGSGDAHNYEQFIQKLEENLKEL